MARPLNPWAPLYIPDSLALSPEYCYSLPAPPQMPLPALLPYAYHLNSFGFEQQLSLAVGGCFEPCGGLWDWERGGDLPLPIMGPGEVVEVQPWIFDASPEGAAKEEEKAGDRADEGCCGGNGRSKWRPKGWSGFGGFTGRRKSFPRYKGRRNPPRLPAEGFEFKEEAAGGDGAATGNTTLMIKNLPNKFTKEQLLELLDEHCRVENRKQQGGGDSILSEYDFLYLPMDFRSGSNLGYAFVNFTSARGAGALHRSLERKDWSSFRSTKICEITCARIQGLPALMQHFKNSIFVCHTDDYLPVRFTPNRNGFRRTVQHHVGKRIPTAKEPTTA